MRLADLQKAKTRVIVLKEKLPAMQEFMDNGGTMQELYRIVESHFGALSEEEREVILNGVRIKGIELDIKL